MTRIPTTLLALLIGSTAQAGGDVSLQPSNDRHMQNLQQLTFEGDNGEAYFSADGRQLIYQSNRGGYACDKIWTMDIDGGNKRMVSPDHGAHTCSFFYPDRKQIVFASSSHLDGACPPRPPCRVRRRDVVLD